MKTPCAQIQEMIIDQLLGKLSPQQTQTVQQHLDSCSVCQSYQTRLRIQEKELEKMGTQLTNNLEEKQNKVIKAVDNLPARTPGHSRPFAYAVAAGILLVIGLLLYRMGIPLDGTTKLYAMSDIPELFNTARTLHIKGKLFFPEFPNTPPAETEYWLDIENGRWRSAGPSYCISEDGIDVWYFKEIYNGQGTKLSINTREKTCRYYKLSEFQKDLNIQQTQRTLLQLTCGTPDFFDTYRIQGQEELNGETYNIWEGQLNIGPTQFKITSWLSPRTGHLAKAEFSQLMENKQWAKRCTFDIVEIDQPIDKSIFELAVPDDYTAANTRETAQEMSMAKMVAGMSSVHIEYYLLYALPDNRLIMCWRNEFLKNPEEEHTCFNDLSFGGPVPKLPGEAYGLKAQIGAKECFWQGRHLAYTQKDGKFYEWAVYIPEQLPPTKPNHTYSYTRLYRMNNGEKASVTTAGSPDVTIEDQEDFDQLVLGAMRQLSDDPDMAAPFTLDEVLSLKK